MNKKDVFLKIASFCAYQERSEQEVIQKLTSWETDPEDIEAILGLLKDEKYLDNKRFVSSYVNGRFRLKKWGKIKIEAFLRQKGLDSDLIQEATNQISTEDYHDVLFQLITKKNNSISKIPLSDRKVKIARYLASKGFEGDLIWKCINSYNFES